MKRPKMRLFISNGPDSMPNIPIFFFTFFYIANQLDCISKEPILFVGNYL